MHLLKKTIMLAMLMSVVLLPACSFTSAQNEPTPEPAAEPKTQATEEPIQPEPIEYKNPLVAMMDGYFDAVEIEIKPAWNLTEAQKATAGMAPVKCSDGKRGYIYPEDKAPTAEQLANGSALTARQRQLMKQARLYARRLAAYHTRVAAEKYNKDHSAELAKKEKAGVHVIIHLRKQRGVCKDGDKVIRTFRVCTGRTSHPTPKGHFHIMEKHAKHKSNVYNDAPMPFFMRLTVNGVGLHQGKLMRYPASHGCIRLSWDDARFLFNKCTIGTAVFIEN